MAVKDTSNIQRFTRYLLSTGWELKRNHYYRKNERGEFRMKFCARVIRYECRVNHTSSQSWVRLRAASLKDIDVQDDRIVGFKR